MTLERKSRSQDQPVHAEPSQTQHFGKDEIPGTGPTTGGAPAPTHAAATSTAPELVQTRWLVDYETVGGKSTKLPDRYGNDQMIVDELKIRPNHGRSERLSGGNMATSGDVLLGTRAIAKGDGKVSAAVRYAKKRSFDVNVRLQPAGSPAERKLLAETKKEIQARAAEMVEDRGDYQGIAVELQAQFADRFPDKKLTIEIDPLARGQATEQYVADGAEYTADEDSTFAVMVEPGGQKDQTRSYSRSQSGEEGELESDQSGIKSTSEVGTRNKSVDKVSVTQAFKKSLKTNVDRVFKNLEEKMDTASDQQTKVDSDQVTWTVGVEPPKEKKGADDAKDDAKKPSGGIAGKIKQTIWKKLTGVFRSGKNLVKRFALLGAGLELAGSLWDTLSTRGKISRESTDLDSDTRTKTRSESDKQVQETSTLSTLASELTTDMENLVEHQVEAEIASKMGTEVSATKKTDASRKTTTSTSSSTTTVVHEVGRPRLVVKKLG